MTLSTEYLAIVRKNAALQSDDALRRLLSVDGNIKIDGSQVTFEESCVCTLSVSSAEMADECTRYFHLKLIWPADPDSSSGSTEQFLALRRSIRTAIQRLAQGAIEVLRDDYAERLACESYPLLHKIENLMRRLIAHFMLINVGVDWTKEALPTEVAEAMVKSKNRDSKKINGIKEKKSIHDCRNILHSLDFDDLGKLLFSPYANSPVQELFHTLESSTAPDDWSALSKYVPKSNWHRYFKGIIGCEDTYLESRWDQLYRLRCKVAHNQLIEDSDFEKIKRLCAEVEPKLAEAVRKISNVNVPRTEVDQVAANALANADHLARDFFALWVEFESRIRHRLVECDTEASGGLSDSLRRAAHSSLSHKYRKAFDNLYSVRNRLVHGGELDEHVLKEGILYLRILIDDLQSHSADA